jgi:hypothetical protein
VLNCDRGRRHLLQQHGNASAPPAPAGGEPAADG